MLSKRMGIQKLCTLLLLTSVVVRAAQSQSDDVVWEVPPEISSEDRRSIVEVARAAGISAPAAVSVPIASSCVLLEVESKPVVVGNRVLSTVLAIRQKHAPGCRPFRNEGDLKQRGNWVAFLSAINPRQEERWRIRDDDWHIDVRLTADVPYGDAVMIVRAIRLKQLVDRRPPRRASAEIRYIDPSRISGISTGIRSASPSIPRQYWVGEVTTGAGRGGGGYILVVRIHDGLVELHQEMNVMF